MLQLQQRKPLLVFIFFSYLVSKHIQEKLKLGVGWPWQVTIMIWLDDKFFATYLLTMQLSTSPNFIHHHLPTTIITCFYVWYFCIKHNNKIKMNVSFVAPLWGFFVTQNIILVSYKQSKWFDGGVRWWWLHSICKFHCHHQLFF